LGQRVVIPLPQVFEITFSLKEMIRETRSGLTLEPSMRLKLTITEKENAKVADVWKIAEMIKSGGYEVKILPDENHPQAILVKR